MENAAGEDHDLVSRAVKWLNNKSGYPLEMLAAAALSKAGFNVVQGDYFVDHGEDGRELSREIDVTGYITHLGNNVQISAALMVECKSAKEAPWLLFSYAHGYSETLQVVRRCATTAVGSKVLSKLQFDEEIRQSALFPFLSSTGYSLAIMRDRGGNDDPAYQALMGVCKASVAHVKQLERRNVLAFDWPIVVTKAPLLECYLDETRQVIAKQIDCGTLVWRNPVVNSTTVVDIYTLPAFEARAPALCDAAKTFVERVWQNTQEP
jgi:hypothetical protein